MKNYETVFSRSYLRILFPRCSIDVSMHFLLWCLTLTKEFCAIFSVYMTSPFDLFVRFTGLNQLWRFRERKARKDIVYSGQTPSFGHFWSSMILERLDSRGQSFTTKRMGLARRHPTVLLGFTHTYFWGQPYSLS